jgi:hypothetical protein
MTDLRKAALLTSLMLLSISAQASEALFTELGLRTGIDSEQSVDLASYEVFGLIETPYEWALTEQLHADLYIEVGLGALTGDGETAAYGHIGPLLSLSYAKCPLRLTLSSGPTLLSEDTFGSKDIGGHFHFTSGIGLTWDVNEQWRIGYQLQHTSNSGIDSPNPGLDMHTLSFGFAF